MESGISDQDLIYRFNWNRKRMVVITTDLCLFLNDFIGILSKNLSKTWQDEKTTYHVFEISGSL